MSRTTEHLQARLENPDLSPEYRKLIEKALKTQKNYHGFHIGDRVVRTSSTGEPRTGVWEVVDMELFVKKHPSYKSRSNPYVPVKAIDRATGYTTGYINGLRPNRLKKIPRGSISSS